MGQWSESPWGRIKAVMIRPVRRRSSEIMNLYNLEATWEVPPLLLFHVKMPFILSISTSLILLRKFWKAIESLPSDLVPHLFSVRDMIILKSPPRIQGTIGCLSQLFQRGKEPKFIVQKLRTIDICDQVAILVPQWLDNHWKVVSWCLNIQDSKFLRIPK